MMADFSALESELLETFGDHGPLPKLSTLQKMHRQDLEQVSTHDISFPFIFRIDSWERFIGMPYHLF